MVLYISRMTPNEAIIKGHNKCNFCQANINAAMKYKKDVLVSDLSGDVIGVAFD